MLALFATIVGNAPDLAFSWDFFKWALSTGLAGWALKVLLNLRDEARRVLRKLDGEDGRPGLIAIMEEFQAWRRKVDDRHLEEDAVEVIEQQVALMEGQHHHGDDRRKNDQRIREMIRDELERRHTAPSSRPASTSPE